MFAITKREVICLACATFGSIFTGCANLDVHKVPLSERAAHCDHEQGFRYYLNRPYIVVKKPILIVENRSLVRVDRHAGTKTAALSGGMGSIAVAEGASGAPEQTVLTFLSGPRQGQKISMADLRVETPGTGELRPVSLSELERMNAALSEDTGTDSEDFAGTKASAGTPGGNPSGGNASAGGGSAALEQPTLATVQHTPPLTGDIAVVYLPDMDEQYVIKSCNFVSKSAFGLAIRNGSELVEVQGDHDSTALPLAILTQIQKAIAAVSGATKQATGQQSSASGGAGGGGRGTPSSADIHGQQMVWNLIERTSIKPGVYRLNKPWECDHGNQAQPVGCGLLAKLGLPTVVEVDLKPVGSIVP